MWQDTRACSPYSCAPFHPFRWSGVVSPSGFTEQHKQPQTSDMDSEQRATLTTAIEQHRQVYHINVATVETSTWATTHKQRGQEQRTICRYTQLYSSVAFFCSNKIAEALRTTFDGRSTATLLIDQCACQRDRHGVQSYGGASSISVLQHTSWHSCSRC